MHTVTERSLDRGASNARGNKRDELSGSGKGGKRKGESKSAGPTRVRAGRGRVWAVSIRTADSAFTILERRNFTHAATLFGNTI